MLVCWEHGVLGKIVEAIGVKGSSNTEVESGGHLKAGEEGFGHGGINVRTDVDLRIEEVRMEIERESKKVMARR